MNAPAPPSTLDRVHHVAISVNDVAAAVAWYTSTFRCAVSFQDATWALLDFDNLQLALVVPGQHPPHVAFTNPKAEDFGELTTHRDGTRSAYVNDPAGNFVEIMAAD